MILSSAVFGLELCGARDHMPYVPATLLFPPYAPLHSPLLSLLLSPSLSLSFQSIFLPLSRRLQLTGPYVSKQILKFQNSVLV